MPVSPINYGDRHSPASSILRRIVCPTVLTSVLNKADLKTETDLETLASDVMAITRGMTDMAGIRRELDGVALRAQTRQAVFGYLGLTPPRM